MAKQITPELIAKCTRCVDPSGAVYYHVESDTTPGRTYAVSCITVKDGRRICVCTCDAGWCGKRCWHVNASLMHAAEYRESQRCYVVEETMLTSTMTAYRVQQNGKRYYGTLTQSGYGCSCQHFQCKHSEAVHAYRARQAERQLSAA